MKNLPQVCLDQIALILRGGCRCEEPDFYYASLSSVYRCSKCGAAVSIQLLPEELKPKEQA